MNIEPEYSVQQFRKATPYRDTKYLDELIQLLIKAGLPEIEPASKEKMEYQLPEKPSIAVFPFINMSNDPEQEYLSDGITEEIITALSKTSKLFVIARTSSFQYKGKGVDVGMVGRELGVRTPANAYLYQSLLPQELKSKAELDF